MNKEKPIQKIFKYPLRAIHGYVTIEMPHRATILKIANQRGTITLWARVYEKNPLELRSFKIIWTGEPFGDPLGNYLETVEIGALQQHIFEIPARDDYETDEDDFG